jgi:hypothetical protein
LIQEPTELHADAGEPPAGLVTRLVRSLQVSEESRPWFSLLCAAWFGIALTCVHASHELWRDELHCWSLGRNAQGLADLLTGVRRYDGHPFLWYYLLYLVSRLSRSPVALHATTIGLATLSSYLWLRDARLPRWLRMPLLASYMFFYEYSVLSRSYALGILCLFLFCRCYQRQKLRIPSLVLLLVLLSFTSVYGVIIAIALGSMVCLQGLTDACHAAPGDGGRRRAFLGPGLGLLVLGVGIYLTWLTSMPPPDAHFVVGQNLVRSAAWPTVPLSYWQASFPRCNPENGTWMVTAALGDDWAPLGPWLPYLGVAWAGLWLWALRREPWVALAYAAGVAGIAAFQSLEYSGYLRHFGHYFVLLIACVWLHTKQRSEQRPRRLLHGLLAATMAVQVVTCSSAATAELELPFSGSLEAARYLRATELDQAPMVGSFDHAVSAVAGYLDRSFRSADTDEQVTSVVFHNRRWHARMPLPVIFEIAVREAKRAGRPAIVILTRDLEGYARPDALIEQLYVTPRPIVASEQFNIVRVTPTGP